LLPLVSANCPKFPEVSATLRSLPQVFQNYPKLSEVIRSYLRQSWASKRLCSLLNEKRQQWTVVNGSGQ
jgi:hypothetical protein